jgi:arabinoxylan arabinofuranohydrolase
LGNNGTTVDAVQALPVASTEKNRKKSVVSSDEFNNSKTRYLTSEKYADSKGKGGEFDYNGSNLRLEWQWNHNPDNRYWSLTDRKGWLRLKGGVLAHNIRDARNTLTQRVFGPQCEAVIKMDISKMKDGDCAGLSLFQNRYGYVGVEQKDGVRSLVMRKAMEKGDAEGKVIEQQTMSQKVIYLKCTADFRNRTDKGAFYYSTDGKTWKQIGDELAMYFDWPDFCGQRVGIFYFPTQQTGGSVDVDYFHINVVK